MNTVAGTGAAVAAAQIAQAIKASGGIVQVDPSQFASLLQKSEHHLVVKAPGGFWRGGYRYLMPYKGLYLYTQSRSALELPADTEIIVAQTIWVPG